MKIQLLLVCTIFVVATSHAMDICWQEKSSKNAPDILFGMQAGDGMVAKVVCMKGEHSVECNMIYRTDTITIEEAQRLLNAVLQKYAVSPARNLKIVICQTTSNDMSCPMQTDSPQDVFIVAIKSVLARNKITLTQESYDNLSWCYNGYYSDER